MHIYIYVCVCVYLYIHICIDGSLYLLSQHALQPCLGLGLPLGERRPQRLLFLRLQTGEDRVHRS